MREYLSKKLNPRGFTLIELLITVAILAILAVVAVAVYSNTQGAARDARRRADISAIISAADTAKAAANTATYPAITATNFSSGALPDDPTPGNTYCLSTAVAPGSDPATGPFTTCTQGTFTTDFVAAGGIPATATRIRVCAWLESPTTPIAYCKTGTAQ